MSPIKVLVHGALGRMGGEVAMAVSEDPELELVGGMDVRAKDSVFRLPQGEFPLSAELAPLLEKTCPDVLVDFTRYDATLPAARLAAQQKVNLVIGTTGLSPEDLRELEELCRKHGIGAVVAPNFSLGAVLMMYLAKIAARFFDWAEIIEAHHEGKLDAPSGTAIATARAMVESRGRGFSRVPTEKESLPGSRGTEFEGLTLHSVRLPGLMAHQEVILGAPGQTLTIRHDQISRKGYMPGVLQAIKRVVNLKGLVFGLEKILGL